MKADLFCEALEILRDFAKGLIFDKTIFVHVQSAIELNLQAVAFVGWICIFANQFGAFVRVVDAYFVA